MTLLFFRIAIDFISKKKESLKQSVTTKNEVKSLLELYLSSKELDMKDVTGMAVDMLLAGVDTVRLCTMIVAFRMTSPAAEV